MASVVFGNNIEMLCTTAFHISVLSDDISLLEITLVAGKAVAPDRKVMAKPPLWYCFYMAALQLQLTAFKHFELFGWQLFQGATTPSPEDSSIATNSSAKTTGVRRTADEIGQRSKMKFFCWFQWYERCCCLLLSLGLVWFAMICFVEIKDFGPKMKADQLCHSPGRCCDCKLTPKWTETDDTVQSCDLSRDINVTPRCCSNQSYCDSAALGSGVSEWLENTRWSEKKRVNMTKVRFTSVAFCLTLAVHKKMSTMNEHVGSKKK